MQDARMYLEQSEALIRTHGLPKSRKSQKVSKLHHIFSYLRIIEESTSPEQHELENGFEEDQDTSIVLRRNSNVSSSRLAWVEDDEPEDNHGDSLFISIYQLPTTLLSLLAQTSSLCKLLHTPEASTPEFDRRCQIIEDRIFRWKAPRALSITSSRMTVCNEPGRELTATANISEIAAHLVAALHSALIVHFQRQVRNTDPRVLQHYIIHTIDHLLLYESLKKISHVSSAPFAWPGFIVGCEAYDSSARQKMETYLDSMRGYNVGNLETAERVIREVWRRQDLGREDRRWANVLRDWNIHIVLT